VKGWGGRKGREGRAVDVGGRGEEVVGVWGGGGRGIDE